MICSLYYILILILICILPFLLKNKENLVPAQDLLNSFPILNNIKSAADIFSSEAVVMLPALQSTNQITNQIGTKNLSSKTINAISTKLNNDLNRLSELKQLPNNTGIENEISSLTEEIKIQLNDIVSKIKTPSTSLTSSNSLLNVMKNAINKTALSNVETAIVEGQAAVNEKELYIASNTEQTITTSIPVSTTPASTTPASTTPAWTTRFATTPASTTPASTTPASTTPAWTTRFATTPASTTPASTTPASTTPASTTPASTTTASTTPASTTTASTTPAWTTTFATTPAWTTTFATTPASTDSMSAPIEYSTAYSTTPSYNTTTYPTPSLSSYTSTIPYSSYPPSVSNADLNDNSKYDMYLDKNIIDKGETASSYMMIYTPDPNYNAVEREIVEKQTILDFFKHLFNKYSRP